MKRLSGHLLYQFNGSRMLLSAVSPPVCCVCGVSSLHNPSALTTERVSSRSNTLTESGVTGFTLQLAPVEELLCFRYLLLEICSGSSYVGSLVRDAYIVRKVDVVLWFWVTSRKCDPGLRFIWHISHFGFKNTFFGFVGTVSIVQSATFPCFVLRNRISPQSILTWATPIGIATLMQAVFHTLTMKTERI